MYKIKNNAVDMVIAGIKPGSSKNFKELSPKMIKYHNQGLLTISFEEDKVVKEKKTTTVVSAKEDIKSNKKDEVKE